MKNRSTAYWACQILGWGSYVAIGLVVSLQLAGPHLSIWIGYALFWIYSIALTHLMRREIRRRQWLAMPFRKSIPRLVGASLLVGAIIGSLVLAISSILDRAFLWSAQSAGGLFAGLLLFTVGWTTLYVAITSTRATLQGRLALRESELRALEGQVNPHFLFNCLNSIRGMISENPSQAQDMVTRLANIFRYNLQRDRSHTVPLSQEIAVVSDYLALERVRFEDRLRVTISIDRAAESAPVPAMLLQTLVENALKHGLSDRPDGGELLIEAKMRSDELVLRVENTGELAEPKPGATQVGLKNARERLRLLYGDRASLSLANQGGGRVSATVMIPRIA